jgi:hypothetical protein
MFDKFKTRKIPVCAWCDREMRDNIPLKTRSQHYKGKEAYTRDEYVNKLNISHWICNECWKTWKYN